jgi:hypothetical protein
MGWDGRRMSEKTIVCSCPLKNPTAAQDDIAGLWRKEEPFRASSTTGCAALHELLKMRENIFLNKKIMISFYWVDVEILRGRRLVLHPGTRLRRRIMEI